MTEPARCLDEASALAYLRETLPGEQSAAVEAHLQDCEACRGLLRVVTRPELGTTAEAAALGDDTTIDVGRLSAPETEAFSPGKVLDGRYQIVSVLGSGAMGTVYEAVDLVLEEHVAVKLLRPELESVPQLIERLQQELVLGRRITHPNICRLHDIGKAGKRPFVSMELVQGESLDRRLDHGSLGEDETIEILVQVCSALEAAHAQGVVHRDLKPANVMLGDAGKITVMDFGVARDMHGERTQTGVLIGSPAYWAPEQSRGERATARSDVYAVGVLACELFGAERPTFGQRGLPGVPARYRKTLLRCLRPDPDARWPSAGALRKALLQAQHGRRSVAPTAIAASVVVALAAGGVAWWTSRPEQRAASPEPTPISAPAAPEAAPPAAVPAPPMAPAPVADPPPVIATAPPAPETATPHAKTRRRRRPADAKPPSPGPGQPADRAPAPESAAAPPVETPTVAPATEATPEPAPEPTAPPPTVDPGQVVAAQRRLDALETVRKGKDLLRSDVPGYGTGLRRAREALARGDASAAEAAIRPLEVQLEATRVDRAFVGDKLKRINGLKKSRELAPEAAAKVKASFAKVHARYFAGDAEGANRHLNDIWALLH